jgi:purine-binding chemotaxis protein CheW
MSAPARTIDWEAAHRRLEAWQDALARGAAPSAENIREELRRRAHRLAAPKAAAAVAESLELLVFAVGDSRFGVRLRQLEAVVAADGLVPVPCTPATIRGVVAHRGEALAVIDLAAYVGLPQPDPTEAGTIVVVQGSGRRVGIFAEALYGIESLAADALVPIASLLIDDRAGALDGATASAVILIDTEHLTLDRRVRVDDDGD